MILVRTAVLAERARRKAADEELRAVLTRILVTAPGRKIHCSTITRLCRQIGVQASADEIAVAIAEVYPDSSWTRIDGGARAFAGVGLRPGFSLADIGEFLQRRWLAAHRGRGAKKRPPAPHTGVVASWESQLAEEGLRPDVNSNAPDPVGRDFAQLSRSVTGDEGGDDDGEDWYSGMPTGHGTGHGAWGNAPREYPPAIAPALADARIERYRLARRLGFFTGKGAVRGEIWRLHAEEGLSYPTIGKLLQRSPGACRVVMQKMEARLARHLAALGPHQPPDEDIGPRESGLRYLYSNRWTNPQERDVWAAAILQHARPAQIARDTGMDRKQVAAILRKHRVRAGRKLDRI